MSQKIISVKSWGWENSKKNMNLLPFNDEGAIENGNFPFLFFFYFEESKKYKNAQTKHSRHLKNIVSKPS
jgi:hypothetical protein